MTDPFRAGTLRMLASPRGADADHRAKGVGAPTPCRILLMREPDETGQVTSRRMTACGHHTPSLLTVARGDTLTVGSTAWSVGEVAEPELGWDWRVILSPGAA